MEKYAYSTDLTANGGCYVCRSTNNLVSTGVIIEGEGLLALCGGCINDMAVTAGFKVNGQDEFDRLKDQVNIMQRVNAVVTEERDEAQEKLAAMREQWVEAVEAHS